MLRLRVVENLQAGAMGAEGFRSVPPPAVAVFRIGARVEHGAAAHAAYAGMALGKDKPVQALRPGEVLLFVCFLHGFVN